MTHVCPEPQSSQNSLRANGGRAMIHKCDWPHCEAQSEHPFTDGWCVCSSGGASFLPDPCQLCPKHGQLYEEMICNPWLLEKKQGCDEDQD
jgi:hypothetical protein